MSSPDATDGCCAPSRGGTSQPAAPPERPTFAGAAADVGDLIDIPDGSFIMGTDEPYRYQGDSEGPAREITVGPYRIATDSVTNRQFAAFVEDTGHRTEAEVFEWSFVFHLFLPDDFPPTRAVAATPWWRQVFGADWAHPAGPQSDLADLWDHPVTHVSWNDAAAHCEWAGVRLPTEGSGRRRHGAVSCSSDSCGATTSHPAGRRCATSSKASSRR